MNIGASDIFNLAVGGVIFYGFTRLLNKLNATSSSDSNEDDSVLEKTPKKQLNFEEKRKKGVTGSCGGVRVRGGLLPKSGSIGAVEFLYDGSFPTKKGKKGKADLFVTDGNIQVIYKDKKQAESICFEGKIADTYFKS